MFILLAVTGAIGTDGGGTPPSTCGFEGGSSVSSNGMEIIGGGTCSRCEGKIESASTAGGGNKISLV